MPGYHFHFISKDRTKGGHVLDCAAQQLRASIQIVSEYDVRLPEAGSFLAMISAEANIQILQSRVDQPDKGSSKVFYGTQQIRQIRELTMFETRTRTGI